MAKSAVLNIDVFAKVESAIKSFGDLKSKSTGALDTIKNTAAAFATGVAGEMSVATKAAMDHEEHVARLAQSYRNVGAPAGEMKKALEEIDAQSRRTGQSTDDNVDAYSKLVTVTHNTDDAMRDLATAQDLAAYKGISVEKAADAIGRATVGNTRALRDLGIATVDASGHQLDAKAVVEKLTAAVHGQADAMGDTAAGKIKRYHEALDQMQVKIGEAVLPVLTQLIDLLAPIFDWLTKNESITRILIPVLAGLGAAIVAVNTGIKIWTAAQTALDVVLNANPIGLVVIAIAALVAGIIVAYNKVKWFHDAIDAIGRAFKAVGDWIMSNWKIVIDVLLGPLGIVLTNFDKIEQAIKRVIDWLGKIKDKASEAFGWLGKVGGFLSHIPGLHELPGGPGLPSATPTGAPTMVAIYVQPGDNFAEAVYDGLRAYQRRHARPELAGLFG